MTKPKPGRVWHIPEAVERLQFFDTLIGGQGGNPDTPSTDEFSFHLYRLAENQRDEQTPHREDELYYVYSGSRCLVVDDGTGTPTRTDLKPGDLAYVPANATHSFEGSDEIVLLVFFAPSFSDAS